MISCYVTGWDGESFALPSLLDCKFSYGIGTPCDSFWVKCLWPEGDREIMERAVRFFAEENGVRRFTGVVDEFSYEMGENGATMEVTGRGMAALLLDNEAEARQYQTATWSDIFVNHIAPYGIRIAGDVSLQPVNGFVVPSGGSEWQVLFDFACYHGGVEPWFDPAGRLVLGKKRQPSRILDDETAVTHMGYKSRRYGVLSEIVVRDKVQKTAERVANVPFQKEGGVCRRVVTMPARSNYRAMRYSGEYQLKKSAEGRKTLTVTVPAVFFAMPQDRVTIRRKMWQADGQWRVISSETAENPKSGGYTTLELAGE
ncbi:MAG: hypothetical protein RSB55_08480 [Oscillospiraceae bacterium]